ncbi:uncharacterized protein LOC119484032 [Sebastes umbrosus]|uniref:uncharacterized protein LOC119484032 n=1 Tax=Sebastes umbrosus TaxID=72105 RepID=UPI00189DF18E|nr:uncharacterized protein LOC119484032 [Sebastes umbrosus]
MRPNGAKGGHLSAAAYLHPLSSGSDAFLRRESWHCLLWSNNSISGLSHPSPIHFSITQECERFRSGVERPPGNGDELHIVRCVAGEKKNRHADSSDKQLHRGLFGRQAGMSSGRLAGQKIEYSRDGGGKWPEGEHWCSTASAAAGVSSSSSAPANGTTQHPPASYKRRRFNINSAGPSLLILICPHHLSSSLQIIPHFLAQISLAEQQ